LNFLISETLVSIFFKIINKNRKNETYKILLHIFFLVQKFFRILSPTKSDDSGYHWLTHRVEEETIAHNDIIMNYEARTLACPCPTRVRVRHVSVSVSDTDTTFMVIFNYMIFSNYYRCRRVGVCVVSGVMSISVLHKVNTYLKIV
jgi:hypothetical protein